VRLPPAKSLPFGQRTPVTGAANVGNGDSPPSWRKALLDDLHASQAFAHPLLDELPVRGQQPQRFRFREVFALQPDNMRRRSEEQAQLLEIRVVRDDDEVLRFGVLPNLAIWSALQPEQ